MHPFVLELTGKKAPQTGLEGKFSVYHSAAVAIIAPVALGFAYRFGISPLLMGIMVVHGAQAGGFSPISAARYHSLAISRESLPAELAGLEKLPQRFKVLPNDVGALKRYIESAA